MNNTKDPFSAIGFSIIELVIVIVIAAILATLAIPNYLTFIADNHATELANTLNTAIRLTKSEALHRGENVKICALNSAGSTTCNDTAAVWQYGWQIIGVSSGDILHTYQPSDASAISLDIASSIVYQPSGFPTTTEYVFTIKPTDCSRGYQITYNLTATNGALQSQQVSCP